MEGEGVKERRRCILYSSLLAGDGGGEGRFMFANSLGIYLQLFGFLQQLMNWIFFVEIRKIFAEYSRYNMSYIFFLFYTIFYNNELTLSFLSIEFKDYSDFFMNLKTYE